MFTAPKASTTARESALPRHVPPWAAAFLEARRREMPAHVEQAHTDILDRITESLDACTDSPYSWL